MSQRSIRKMSLQLTPLLDLLLIVIFAQYLEVQETQVATEQQSATAVLERDQAAAENAKLQATLADLEAALELLKSQLAVQSDQLRQAEDLTEQSIRQQQVVGELLSQLFNVPEQDIDAVLNPNGPPPGRTAAEIQRLKNRFRQISTEQSGRILEHLLTYDEIRKRCDVWNIHITPDNFLILSSGDISLKMQVPIDIEQDFVQQEFVDQFVETAHTLPDPKSLVILMLTYDRKSQRWATQGARETLPEIALRLNRTGDARTRYEYADLGFRIE